MRNRFSIFLMPLIVLLFCAQATVAAQEQGSTIFGPETFTRSAGQPQTVIRNFTVQDPSQPYTLTIRNGQGGDSRVSSAVITVNGVTVAGPSDFSKQNGLIIKPVSLQQDNTLSVTLRGQPGASLSIMIKQGVAPVQVLIIDSRTDPLLLKVVKADGRVLDYFGDRDAEGLPTWTFRASPRPLRKCAWW